MTKDEIDFAVDKCPSLYCYACPAYAPKARPSSYEVKGPCILRSVFYDIYGVGEDVPESRIHTTNKEFYYRVLLDPLHYALMQAKEISDGQD